MALSRANNHHMDSELRFIGRIHSSLKTLQDCPLQESEGAPEASIEVFPAYMEGIQNFKPGAKIIILTWLHEADRSVIRCISRNNFNSPKLGVFSTRSPDRPNPIGIHQVTIISIQEERITVSALEVLHGTPVIDIKPMF